MKVKRLIEMLSELPQNAEVVLWNGLARDVTPIQPRVTTERMVRPTAVKKDGSRYKWEINEFVTLEDILSGAYEFKQVYVLQAKITGESDYSRYEKMRY